MHKLSFSRLTTLGIVGVIISAVHHIGRILSKIKETAPTLGVGMIYSMLFAALFIAPLPQTNSQSDALEIDIPGDFAFTDIQYDVFPSAMSSHLKILNGCMACLLLHCWQLIVPASFG